MFRYLIFCFFCNSLLADASFVSFTVTSKQFVKGMEPEGPSPIIFDTMSPIDAPFTLSKGTIVVDNPNTYYYRLTIPVQAIGPMNTQPVAYFGFETDGTILNNFTSIFPQAENSSTFGQAPVIGSGSFDAHSGTIIRILNLSSVGISVLPFDQEKSARLDISQTPFNPS